MELLTGQCKKDFEEYYIKFLRKQKDVVDRYCDQTIITYFYRSPLLMQWWVFVNFFDSLCIDIVNDEFFETRVQELDNNTVSIKVVKMIKEANELYNKKHLNNIEVQHEEIKKDGK